ncbi:uncharacterized protein LOC143435185 isoform X2 [Arvicanthis niloticus]|uniref:uncharacterized protein LOC143309528 isoform X2 n=1 Tax=Arvicanthis niloticus TaxID=61156 RepID=UPI00402BEF22
MIMQFPGGPEEDISGTGVTDDFYEVQDRDLYQLTAARTFEHPFLKMAGKEIKRTTHQKGYGERKDMGEADLFFGATPICCLEIGSSQHLHLSQLTSLCQSTQVH